MEEHGSTNSQRIRIRVDDESEYECILLFAAILCALDGDFARREFFFGLESRGINSKSTFSFKSSNLIISLVLFVTSSLSHFISGDSIIDGIPCVKGISCFTCALESFMDGIVFIDGLSVISGGSGGGVLYWNDKIYFFLYKYIGIL